MAARTENVARIVKIACRHRPEHLAGQDLGVSNHRIERRAQLVAHVGEEFALGTARLDRGLALGLYGNRHYLVAYSMETRGYRLFSLSDIEKVEETKWPFVRRKDFSLEAYAQQSFGVFQEKPFNVVWRFAHEVADDVRAYQFHPRQMLEEQADGSVVVRFRAGGATEMCWHLFMWGRMQRCYDRKRCAGNMDKWFEPRLLLLTLNRLP